MGHTITPAPWIPYSDEVNHYSYVRCLSKGAVYEVVRVTHDEWCGKLADFVHEVIFMAEYDEKALTDILRKFDYDSLDAFVLEVNHADVAPKGFVRRPDGSIDREASPAWWIDYMLLASLMAEYFEGREMTAQAADALAKSIVEAGTPANPFYIRRTFLDQVISIPLTDAEIEAIYTVKDERSRMEYLRDEISDLDEDDSCFEGHGQEALMGNEDFLSTVQRHWYYYNGHGGDQQENLREAIKVTIHELFPAEKAGDGL